MVTCYFFDAIPTLNFLISHHYITLPPPLGCTIFLKRDKIIGTQVKLKTTGLASHMAHFSITPNNKKNDD